MTARAEAKKLYEGKFFYEIVRQPANKFGPEHLELHGPFDNIYFTTPRTDAIPNHPEYKYLQVIDGSPRQAFTESEILVTDRRL
jgi:hypothetical protein